MKPPRFIALMSLAVSLSRLTSFPVEADVTYSFLSAMVDLARPLGSASVASVVFPVSVAARALISICTSQGWD